jgi:hypothetical protein
MTNPPLESDLAEVLSAAGSTHHEYEQTALGVRDELWAGFYAAFALGGWCFSRGVPRLIAAA